MILWGPPGCGKTTLALLLAQYADAEFRAISAVLSGLAGSARRCWPKRAQRFAEGRRTVLFVDEVHRFNKAQQDAFLPHIERGTILFVGATTENPSFELNSALLSRCRVHVMEAVSADDIAVALRRALADAERGLGGRGLQVDDESLQLIARAADGDVRRGLTLLEIAADLARARAATITDATLAQVLADRTRRFDKGGEQFYDQISALHKSRAQLQSRCGAVLARAHARRRRRSELPRAPADAHGGGGHRPGRSARAADGDRGLGHATTGWAARRATSRSRSWRSTWRPPPNPMPPTPPSTQARARRARIRHAGGAAAPAQRADEADEAARLRQGLPVRPRRRRRHRAGPDRFPDAMGERVYYEPVERGLEIKLKEKLDALRAAREEAQRNRRGTK